MNDTFEEIGFTDVDYLEDSLIVRCFPEHVTFRGFEQYAGAPSKRTTIRITPKQARQLATFLSDYADQQGV